MICVVLFNRVRGGPHLILEGRDVSLRPHFPRIDRNLLLVIGVKHKHRMLYCLCTGVENSDSSLKALAANSKATGNRVTTKTTDERSRLPPPIEIMSADPVILPSLCPPTDVQPERRPKKHRDSLGALGLRSIIFIMACQACAVLDALLVAGRMPRKK